MRKPVLAKSEDRSVLALQHEYSGDPEEWIESTISFDFFVNWQYLTVQKEIWVKGILDKGETPPPDGIEAYLAGYDSKFTKKRRFAEDYGFDLHYIAFDDSEDWTRDDSVLYDIHETGSGWVSQTVDLNQMKGRIYELSGGETRMGSKGLIYSTSNLEAQLSHTEYVWPGDADGIIIGNNKRALALLEYKKHTKPYSYRGVCHYYKSGADKKKYNRLQLLRDAIDPSMPFITVTYPTPGQFRHVLLELIDIDVERGEISVVESQNCCLPDKNEDNREYKNAVNDFIKLWSAR